MEQMEFNIEISSNSELKDNVYQLATLAFKQANDSMDTIENKHEAYGIAAESFQVLSVEQKAVKAAMEEFLKILPADNQRTINICGTINAAAQKVAASALDLAAKAQKVMNDLYYDEPTPIEQALETSVDEEGFEEAEDPTEAEESAEE